MKFHDLWRDSLLTFTLILVIHNTHLNENLLPKDSSFIGLHLMNFVLVGGGSRFAHVIIIPKIRYWLLRRIRPHEAHKKTRE